MYWAKCFTGISGSIIGFPKIDEQSITKKIGDSEDDDDEPTSSSDEKEVTYPKCEGADAHVCSFEDEEVGELSGAKTNIFHVAI